MVSTKCTRKSRLVTNPDLFCRLMQVDNSEIKTPWFGRVSGDFECEIKVSTLNPKNLLNPESFVVWTIFVTGCLILLQVQVITFVMGSAISLRNQNQQRKRCSHHPLLIGEDGDLILMLQSLHAVTCHCITYQVLSMGFFTYCILFQESVKASFIP